MKTKNEVLLDNSLLEEVLEKIVDSSIQFFFYLGIPLNVLSLSRYFFYGWMPIMGVHIFILGLLFYLKIFREKINYRIKSSIIIFGLFAIGVGGVFQNKNFVIGNSYHLTVTILIILFFSRKAALLYLFFVISFTLYLDYFYFHFANVHEKITIVSNSILGYVVIQIVDNLKKELFWKIIRLNDSIRILDLAKMEAESANRAKSSFLANMSHELRTPLNGILGASHLIQDSTKEDETQKYSQIISSSGSGLLAILNDILDLSKIESGKMQIEKNPFSLFELIDEITNLQKISAESKGLKFTVNCNAEEDVILVSDRLRIKQVLLNLIGNAIKFTDSGFVSLNVNFKEGDSTLYFNVNDSGIGITEEKQKKLFNRFEQVDSSNSRIYGGTGLGLAISKMLCELLGGSLSMKSQIGVGTSIDFSFPIEVSSSGLSVEKEIEPEVEHKISPTNKDLKILLVEDNETNRLIAKMMLGKIGYKNIISATNGQEAFEEFQKNQFDIILMDVQMPIMDGLESSRRIREHEVRIQSPFQVPIVALTANAMENDRKECLDAGMNDFLTKPIDRNLLREKIQIHCHK
ncbi:MAG: response regulator [Leptospiraceae bacterium]|nr:response regulator [Leptospiraceae bacterium]